MNRAATNSNGVIGGNQERRLDCPWAQWTSGSCEHTTSDNKTGRCSGRELVVLTYRGSARHGEIVDTTLADLSNAVEMTGRRDRFVPLGRSGVVSRQRES